MQTADFTIAEFRDWAKTKPADESYCYTNASACALCQFLNETGRTKQASVSPDDWADGPLGERSPLPIELNNAVQACGVLDAPESVKWSFGELVSRLEKLCPETVVASSDWSRLDAYLTDIEDVAREQVSA